MEALILSHLDPYGYFTWSDIRERCGDIEEKSAEFDKTLLALVKEGKVLTAQVTDSKYRYPMAGYKLPPKEKK